MTRREYLIGLFGAAAVAALPEVPGLQALCSPAGYVEYGKWESDISQILHDYAIECCRSGTAGIMTIDEYPYIRLVEAEELWVAPSMRSQ